MRLPWGPLRRLAADAELAPMAAGHPQHARTQRGREPRRPAVRAAVDHDELAHEAEPPPRLRRADGRREPLRRVERRDHDTEGDLGQHPSSRTDESTSGPPAAGPVPSDALPERGMRSSTRGHERPECQHPAEPDRPGEPLETARVGRGPASSRSSKKV
jgi:hypothetical protein